MRNYIRWYDKDKYLSAFMMLLQNLSPEVQELVAQDMLLNIPKIVKQDFDEFINIMSEHNPQSYKRWYDSSPSLHAAIEAMQNLSEQQREELIYSISDIILENTESNFDPNAKMLADLMVGEDE